MTAALPAARRAASPRLGAILLHTAWLSVTLGVVVEAAMLAVALAAGPLAPWRTLVAEFVQTVSWSSLVCLGIAVGSAAARSRPRAMGTLGLLAAPGAFTAAKALHKLASQALALAVPVAAGAPVGLVVLLKAGEYGVLGYAVGRLSERGAGVGSHAAVGLAVGAVFGGALVALAMTSAVTPLPAAAWLTRAVNELLMPLGCAVSLATARLLAARR